jgi:hypothetical protein
MKVPGRMFMGFNGVVNVIARRDGLDISEAVEVVRDCRKALRAGLAKGEDPEEILAQELGLEPDYLFDLL